MKPRSLVTALVVLCLLILPSTAFAQDDAEQDLDIRSRIAAFVEGFVAGDDTAADSPPTSADEQLEDEAAPFEIAPQTVTALVAAITVIFAIGLIVRGYQTPTKRDPFRSKL